MKRVLLGTPLSFIELIRRINDVTDGESRLDYDSLAEALLAWGLECSYSPELSDIVESVAGELYCSDGDLEFMDDDANLDSTMEIHDLIQEAAVEFRELLISESLLVACECNPWRLSTSPYRLVLEVEECST